MIKGIHLAGISEAKSAEPFTIRYLIFDSRISFLKKIDTGSVDLLIWIWQYQ